MNQCYFYCNVLAVFFLNVFYLHAIEAENMEEYRNKLPHVNMHTRQISTSGIASYGGMKITVDGKGIILDHIQQVAACIEIKSVDDLAFVLSYLRDKDFTMRYLSAYSLRNLMIKNKIQKIPELSYTIFLPNNTAQHDKFLKEILLLVKSIKLFDS